MSVFVSEEKLKLSNTLKDFMEKKREYLECFMDRVPVEVAPDYRSIIPAEMYFSLISLRISSGYYRSQEVSPRPIPLIICLTLIMRKMLNSIFNVATTLRYRPYQLQRKDLQWRKP